MKIFAVASNTAVLLVTVLMAAPVFSQPHSDHGHVRAQTEPLTALTDGEVRRVDIATGKVTIKHGEIKSLEMPPMTMVFTAVEPGMLSGLKVGDKIRFEVEQHQGRMIVTRIVPPS